MSNIREHISHMMCDYNDIDLGYLSDLASTSKVFNAYDGEATYMPIIRDRPQDDYTLLRYTKGKAVPGYGFTEQEIDYVRLRIGIKAETEDVKFIQNKLLTDYFKLYFFPTYNVYYYVIKSITDEELDDLLTLSRIINVDDFNVYILNNCITKIYPYV